MAVSMKVNGAVRSVPAEPDTPLLYVLRNDLELNGAKFGCGLAQCGACTVLVDGKAVKSCNMLAVQAQNAKVTTIEGLAKANGDLHPMQEAFRQNHGLQCGFCTPGMVMSAVGLAESSKNPTEAQIRDALDGNFCRCTGYHNIVKAIGAGARAMASSK